jgi:hypothetical protein
MAPESDAPSPYIPGILRLPEIAMRPDGTSVPILPEGTRRREIDIVTVPHLFETVYYPTREFVRPLLSFDPLYLPDFGDPTLIASNGGGDALSLVYESDVLGLFVVNETREVEPGDAQRAIDAAIDYYTGPSEVAIPTLDENGNVIVGEDTIISTAPPDDVTNIQVVKSERGDVLMYQGDAGNGIYVSLLSIDGIHIEVLSHVEQQSADQAFEVVRLLIGSK